MMHDLSKWYSNCHIRPSSRNGFFVGLHNQSAFSSSNMSEAQADLRETFYQPTPHNVHSEANFLEDARANVALEAPTVRNVQSHIQYAEDPRYHISENKQPFRQEFHQPNATAPATASTSARQAQKVPDSIYRDAANPIKKL
jgi:hypothetical protein